MNQEEQKDLHKIVYTAGTWDSFHLGHLKILQRVRAMSHIMIVGVSTDCLVMQYKGHRPLDDFARRFETVCSVSGADIVIPQVRQFDVERMKRYNVSTVVMGYDWKGLSNSSLMELQDQLEVVFLSRTDGVSSSQIRYCLGQGGTYES